MDVSEPIATEPIAIIFNRIKNLRMKSDQIESIEALSNDKISKKEHKLLHSKPLVNARLDELVKLCQLLYPTLTQNLDLYENSESESEDEDSAAAEIFGNWFLSETDTRLIDELVSRLEDSTFVEKVLEEAAIEFRQQHPYYPCVQDPSLMTEKLKKIISRSVDLYSRGEIISRLVHFGFHRDSLKTISSILDDYFARKLQDDVEVERLGQLKAGGMKETDFKKQAEVDETITHAHIETDTDVATEKGHVDRKWGCKGTAGENC